MHVNQPASPVNQLENAEFNTWRDRCTARSKVISDGCLHYSDARAVELQITVYMGCHAGCLSTPSASIIHATNIFVFVIEQGKFVLLL